MIHIFFIFFPKSHTCPNTRTSTDWWSWPHVFFSSAAWWFCSHVFLSTWHDSDICVGFTVSCDIQIWHDACQKFNFGGNLLLHMLKMPSVFHTLLVWKLPEWAPWLGVQASRVSTLTGYASYQSEHPDWVCIPQSLGVYYVLWCIILGQGKSVHKLWMPCLLITVGISHCYQTND